MDRTQLKSVYKELYNEIRAILFRLDPMGINFAVNKDEYDPEVDTILPRLKDAKSESDVQDIVYEEFIHWFGKDLVGTIDDQIYAEVAREIWAAWIKFNKRIKAK